MNTALIGNPATYINNDWDDVSESLYVEIYASSCREELSRVLQQQECDIDPQFLGFMKTYKMLAELIPLNYTVYDVGCAYGIQGWYFRNHKGYLGIDCDTQTERMCWENGSYVLTGAAKWIETKPQTHHTFAICNYMNSSSDAALVRNYFRNVYCYYPER